MSDHHSPHQHPSAPNHRHLLSSRSGTLSGIALRSAVLLAAGVGALSLALPAGAQVKAQHHRAQPALLTKRACARHAQPLGTDAVSVASRVALRAVPRKDRPHVVSATLADGDPFGALAGARGSEVRHYCGRLVWQRTVVVSIVMRRFLPSASLSERVSFVARTPHGYRVYALGH
jgi:hypothetical protein